MIVKSNGYKKLNLNLSKGRRIEKTHFQLGEDELLSSSFQNPLQTWEKISKKYYSILEIKINVRFLKN